MNSTVLPGYWRLAQQSSVVACPFPDACVGGSGFGDSLCADSFTGYLCAEAEAANTYIDISTQDAEVCDAAVAGFAVLIPILVVVALAVVTIFAVATKNDDQPASSQGYLHATAEAKTSKMCCFTFDSPMGFIDCEKGQSASSASGSVGSPTRNESSSLPATTQVANGSRSIRWLSHLQILFMYYQVPL